jgi:replicative DNA helicase
VSDPQIPPQNLDAEESILGAMLLSPRAVETAEEILHADDFYRGTHGRIFTTAVELHNDGKPVDAITLADELERRGALEEIGGKVRIHELAALSPAVANAKSYAQIVKDTALRRRLITAGQAIGQVGWEGIGDTPDLLAAAERHLTKAVDVNQTDDLVSVGDAATDYVTRIVEANEAGVNLTGLMSKYSDLDKYLTGFYPGQLIVLAARPSVGKSALGVNITDNIADSGKSAAIFSLEMSTEEIVARQLARLSRVPTDKMRRPKDLTAEEINQLRTAAQHLRGRPVSVDENPGQTLPELRATARRAVRKGAEFILVDYLQLVAGDGRRQGDNRQNEVADISRGLKMLAKELHVPILAISQLSRKVDDRPDKRPVLSDLRDSGAIEQDADVVLFLYREELYKQVDPKKARDAELIVAKNRNGEIGTVKLLWFPKRQMFSEPARLQTPAEEKAA